VVISDAGKSSGETLETGLLDEIAQPGVKPTANAEGRAAAEREAPGPDIYFLIFSVPNGRPSAEIRQHVEPHRTWVADLEASGRLFAAGPLLDEEYQFAGSGMMIIRASSIAEAEEIAASDPFHATGARKWRIVPWQLCEGAFEITLRLSTSSMTLS
jgi:uncharacterized protein YciI